MRKRQFVLTKEQLHELQNVSDECQPGQPLRRIQAVLLYGTGCDIEKIIDDLGCSRPSLMEWCVKYQKHGIRGLQDKPQGINHIRQAKIPKMTSI